MSSENSVVPATSPVNPMRRLQGKALLAGVIGLAAGCGGGGGPSGSDGEAGNNPSAPPPQTGGESSSNLPPTSGAFGGGQGKLLFIQSDILPTFIKELDLGSRMIRTVAEVPSTGTSRLIGHVSRAADGSFVVADTKTTSSESRFYLFSRDGTLRRTYKPDGAYFLDVTISPDGRSIAYISPRAWWDDNRVLTTVVYLGIIDTQTGNEIGEMLLGPADPDGSNSAAGVAGRTAWSQDSTLYALIPGGLYRVDRITASPVKLHGMNEPSPGGLAVSPDGKQIWYESAEGSHEGRSLWSVDIASGARKQRVSRSRSGRVVGASFSPDGKWLMFIQERLFYVGSVLIYPEVCSVRLSEDLIDTQDMEVYVLDVGGKRFESKGAVAWF